MANRFFSPNQQFSDATGLPYAGGSVAFYASGTSTPLATYSDSALTIANTNPVVLDSSGRAGNIFLQNLAYKVVLSDVNSNVIWTDDPVYSSDYSARAKLTSGSGSPNGSVAGTAGSASIGADTYWDTTNNILYVCTQTGTSSTAVWTAVNASTAASVVPPPQGYLTPTSGTPVIASDVTGATAIYYTPLVGNLVPIYNGSSFTPTVFSEISLSLVSQHAASTLYDVFAFNNSGVVTLATGPAWSVSTAGSGARGTGAGTTQLSRLNGIWVNTVSMTGRNGSTTYAIAASQATYLGSIFIDATPGQVTCHVSFGQSRKWGVWNSYNRKKLTLQAGDGTALWNYITNTARASNGNSANALTFFAGLPEEGCDVTFSQSIQYGTLSSTTQIIANWLIGIGKNSTTTYSGKKGFGGVRIDASAVDIQDQDDGFSFYRDPPTIGINVYNSLEQTTSVNGSPAVNYQGTSSGMILKGEWWG